MLTVIDKWSRESVLLETSFLLTGQSVVDALQGLSLSRPYPRRSRWIKEPSSPRNRWMNGRGHVRATLIRKRPRSGTNSGEGYTG